MQVYYEYIPMIGKGAYHYGSDVPCAWLLVLCVCTDVVARRLHHTFHSLLRANGHLCGVGSFAFKRERTYMYIFGGYMLIAFCGMVGYATYVA